MPKRIGYLYEKVITLANCTAAELEMCENKHHNKAADKIKADPEKYAKVVLHEIETDSWNPIPPKIHIIYDGIRKKQRTIKVPCLHDQAVHQAIMRVTIPYLEARNYYYNCGSIPGAGQMRVTRAIKRWLAKNKIIKYGETLDIQKFFDNCPHWLVMAALERIFKDKKFLALHAKILRHMSDTGVGLAIGFSPSHWYGNLVLGYIDRLIKERYGRKKRRGKKTAVQLHMARYMDDIALLANSKRVLHSARVLIAEILSKMEMKLKRNWQVFQIRLRGLQFLSYRFFHGFTLLKKSLMYRISHKAIQASKNLTVHNAQGVLSHNGILKHCNSYNFKRDWQYEVISIKHCKKVVSDESKQKARILAA